MTVSQIQSGFRKTGIYTVNFEAIDKGKFTPSEVTDSKICFEKSVQHFLHFVV